LRWSEKAYKEGYGITLHLDSKTRSEIEEFSTSGFIGVKKEGENIILVVPDSKRVIRSVTSESVCEIGKSLGWKVEVRPVKYEELPTFTEVLAAGTAAALVPIKSITLVSKDETSEYIAKESDEAGPICVRLLTTLKGIQTGKIADQFGWLDQVKEAKGYTAKSAVNGHVTNGVSGGGVDAVDVL